MKSILQRIFPTGFFEEMKQLLNLAWPIILMNLFRLLNPTVSMIMCGHLDKIHFDGAALANALINVFGVSIDLGFSTACDTLFAQIYGSENRQRLGVLLQRAMIVMTILYLLLASIHLNIDPILILIQQDAEVARLTSLYVTLYLPGLFFDFQFLTISRYLQNQNVVIPIMVSAFTGCVFNAVSQFVAIKVLGYGIEASAILQATSCFLAFFIQLLYVLISKVYKDTWQGFEFYNSLEAWGIFFKLGIPGIFMIGIEEWTFEIGNFLAGAISEVQLGAQTLTFQIEVFTYTIHIGLAIAVSIRCGQYLGANNPEKAKLSAKVVLFTDFCIAIITSVIIYSTRHYLPRIFTNDSEITALAEKLLLFVGGLQFLDAGISSACGIFRACGLQLRGALVMGSSYYLIGVPLAIVFLFVVKMDIVGFWLGLLIGVFIEVVIYLVLLFRIDWIEQANNAKKHAEESQLEQRRHSVVKFDNRVDDEKTILIVKDSIDSKITQRLSVSLSQRRSISGVSDLLSSMVKKPVSETLEVRNKSKTLIKRIIFVSITLAIFAGAILLKIYLKRSMYVPCIQVVNGSAVNPRKHYPFCNDTMYNL